MSARRRCIPFRIRSGRHDFEGSSNLNGGIVIDLSYINQIAINYEEEIATLGGGITSGEMYEVLARAGYTIPAGTCSDVGFCSLTTCGGVGFATRWLGLSCDHLLEITLVNYEGELVVANAYKNADLFWAVRGGLASNFGIIVSMTYKITPVKYASTYTIYWKGQYFNRVLKCWQRMAPYTNPRLSSDLTYIKDNEGQLYVSSRGQFFGPSEALRSLITPLIECAPSEALEIEELPYEEVMRKWVSACTPPENFKATGVFIQDELEDQVIDYLAKAVKEAPVGIEQFLEFIVMQGAVSGVPADATAFAHRDALYLLEIKAVYEEKQDEYPNKQWVEILKKRLDTVGEGNYRGFTDCALTDWQWQYYRTHYERLRLIKEKYDPYNVFCFNQSIR